MTLRHLLALYVGASLFAVGPAVFADDDDDDDDDDRAAPAMQVMIDADTGKKIEAEDDAGTAPRASAARMESASMNANIAVMVPARSQPPQYHADGSVSAQIGLEHFEYLVVRKDENGEPVVSHVPTGQIDADLPTSNKAEEQ